MDLSRFGNEMRALRNEKNLTIRQLEELSKVSNSYISQIEKGEKLPSPEILKKLAPHLGASHAELLIKAGHLTSDQIDQLSEWESRVKTEPKLKVTFNELQFHLFASYGNEFSRKMKPEIQSLKNHYRDILGDNFKFNLVSLRELEKKALQAHPDVRERIESFFIEIFNAILTTRNNLLLKGDLHYLISVPIVNYKGIRLSATDRKHIHSFLEGLFADRLHTTETNHEEEEI